MDVRVCNDQQEALLIFFLLLIPQLMCDSYHKLQQEIYGQMFLTPATATASAELNADVHNLEWNYGSVKRVQNVPSNMPTFQFDAVDEQYITQPAVALYYI